uniref:Uncharacterized protein n=1 Tax=Trypanosoma vivax (strain Y486) TaxID=1055687 RepID=G0U173_TRYVY|nr:hypothetical protein, conserved in T. vivax [Trypanosoma vivax Y486]
MVAAENGILKALRVQTAAETRGLSAQRGESDAQQLQQCADTVFHAHTAGERQENNDPLMANVGLRGMQVLRGKLSDASFKPEEKIRTHEGALEYLTATSPRQLLTARRVFPMPPRPVFCCKTRGMQWWYGCGLLAKWASRKA